MNRRDFIKLILATPIALELDVERLLWVPGEKKIFLPSAPTKLDEIVAVMYDEIAGNVERFFYQDDLFYTALSSGKVKHIQGSKINVPLIFPQ